MLQSTLKNRTIFCRDNIEVLRGINSNSIDLIYLDPPFNKNRNFNAPIETRKGVIEASFKDTWQESDIKNHDLEQLITSHPVIYKFIQGISSIRNKTDKYYLVFMAVRLIEMHRILKETGSIYLHCDHTMSHFLKLLLDCIFGGENFRNQIVWRIGWVSGYKTKKLGFIRNHDIIYYYVKNHKKLFFNKEYIPYTDNYVRRDGKKPTGKGIPIEDTWNCHTGDILDSIMIKSFSREKVGYPTQKPEALLERIIKASCPVGTENAGGGV